MIGKICVPINPRNPDAFDCTAVPTLTQVINEMGSMAANQRTREEGDSTTPPCLEPFMQTFRDFLEAQRRSQVEAVRQANRERAQAQHAAAGGQAAEMF